MGSIIWIAVDKLKANSYNPNVMSAEKFEALCDFLKGHKAEEVDPIWVRNNGVDDLNLPLFEIIDGEHRWKAAKAVGWKRLRAFVLPIKEDEAKSFNVRKNRERGNIDAIKFGQILDEECEKGAKMEELSKKYCMGERRIRQYKEIYRRKDEILEQFKEAHTAPLITLSRGDRILRDLKQQEKADEEGQEIVKEMVEEYAPTVEKAFAKVETSNSVNPERNKLVLNMLLKNLREGLVFCPACGKKMLECSGCHTSLEKLKESAKI